MKNIKHILAAILALATLGVATGCEGLRLVMPSMGGNSSSSGESSELVDEDRPVTDEEWDEFVELMEKMEKEKNYTAKTTMSAQVAMAIEDLYDEWMSEKGTTTEKYDGRLEEKTSSMKRKSGEDKEWETASDNEKSYIIYPEEFLTGATEGECVHYAKDEKGDWKKGMMYASAVAKVGEEYETLVEKELREAIVYNESTGIYSITDCEITVSAETYLGIELENVKAVQKIHKLEYEIRDGYLVRFYQDVEVDIEGTMKRDDKTHKVDYHTEIKAEREFSDYGETKIKLPSQIKAEVEALLEDEE